MDVIFASPVLASLCNSERQLTERWGVETARSVGRRLLELAAADSADLRRLPRASVSTNGRGETIIAFGEEVVVRGRMIAGAGAAGDCMIVTGLDVGRAER